MKSTTRGADALRLKSRYFHDISQPLSWTAFTPFPTIYTGSFGKIVYTNLYVFSMFDPVPNPPPPRKNISSKKSFPNISNQKKIEEKNLKKNVDPPLSKFFFFWSGPKKSRQNYFYAFLKKKKKSDFFCPPPSRGDPLVRSKKKSHCTPLEHMQGVCKV